jgi:hypothetical protein
MSPTTLARRTLALALLLCSLAVFLVPGPAGAATPAEDEYAFLQKHNQARVSRGIPAMTWDAELAATSRSWSRHMAGQGKISHDPNLAGVATSVDPNWRSAGENVGVGYSVSSLFDAFMNSSGHRANILKSTYNRVGIGVVHSGGKIWVTVRFLQGPAISGTTGLTKPSTSLPGLPGPLTGDFDADGESDLLTYGPGSKIDELWFGDTDRDMAYRKVSVGGQYWPFTGDFDGDGKTEIFWYGPGSNKDLIWEWHGTGWASRDLKVSGVYRPLPGDFDGDGNDDILWYGAGTKTDAFWFGQDNGAFSPQSVTVNGTYRPVTGDLDGRNGDDIFWYGPSTTADLVWFSTGERGRFSPERESVAGSYEPVTGDFNGNGVDDIFWYAPGTTQDATWFMSEERGEHRTVLRSVSGKYLPASGDFEGNDADDMVWFAPSSAAGDPMWYGRPGSTSASPSTVH